MEYIKFHMLNHEPEINLWEKYEFDESLWKDAKWSETRKHRVTIPCKWSFEKRFSLALSGFPHGVNEENEMTKYRSFFRKTKQRPVRKQIGYFSSLFFLQNTLLLSSFCFAKFYPFIIFREIPAFYQID